MIGRYVFRRKFYSLAALLFDAVGYPLCRFFRGKDCGVGNPRNILLVRLDHLGDALMASASLELLKKKFPKARITFLTSLLGAAVISKNPYVDEVLVYEAPWFARGRKGRSPSIPNVAMQLRRREFDLGIAFRGDLRENYLLWRAGVKLRAGYGITGGGFFLNREIPYRFGVHESEHTADLLKMVGVPPGPLVKNIYFSAEEEKEYAAKLRGWGISPEDRWVGFQVDAGTASKTWPESSAAELMRLFAKGSTGEKLVLVGSDRERAERLVEAAIQMSLDEGVEHLDILNLCGKTTLRELFFLLKQLRAFVGPDSGPAHVSAAMGVPTLFLYSGTNEYEQWKPLADNAFVLRRAVPCSPCHKTRCPYPDHPCMSGILPEDVVAWLQSTAKVAQ